jgi:uncharacterized protein YggU (UPF0235/DUF167 family)|tara:strand:+ start:2240 stop:2452 length:213 start_codon:yes stop_codon:yes gene_type:complete
MSLQGQAITAYKNYLNKSMGQAPKEETPTMGAGLLSRNKPVEVEGNKEDYLMDQFKALQKLRAEIANGKT